MIKRFLCLCLLGTAVLTACHPMEDNNPYKNNLGLEPSFLAALDTPNYTTIRWRDTAKDVGAIRQGEVIDLSYRFVNTGDKPLFLSTASATYGCMVVHMPKDPVMPGDSAELIARFDGHVPPGKFWKSVLVTSNTKNKSRHLLVFSGQVIQDGSHAN